LQLKYNKLLTILAFNLYLRPYSYTMPATPRGPGRKPAVSVYMRKPLSLSCPPHHRPAFQHLNVRPYAAAAITFALYNLVKHDPKQALFLIRAGAAGPIAQFLATGDDTSKVRLCNLKPG